MPPTSGKILFLEDLDEYLYHIDRMMYNLKRNGVFDDLAGIVIGGMTDMNDNTVPFGETAEEIIKRHVQDLGIPVAFGFPAGHLDDNRTLIMGRSASLTVGNTTHLKW
jgi:muramoyltetrapeptide carboxypeptidase